MRESKTYIAVPPGETIREILDDRGLTQKDFASRMGLSEKHVSKLINGEAPLSKKVARDLEFVLGMSASFWEKLEQIYRDNLVLVDEENALDEDIAISKKIPFSEMVRLGWINSVSSVLEKITELRKFFEVSRLPLLTESMMPCSFRRADEYGRENYACMAWLQKVRLEAREKYPSPFDRQKFKKSLPEIKKLTTEKDISEAYKKLDALFADCGIALILLPHLKNSSVHGVTFSECGKTVIGVSLRSNYADVFWFSLFHEIGHILTSSEKGAGDRKDETKANNFAETYLIDQKEYVRFAEDKDFSSQSICSFASKLGIAPGIVVGRLQNDKMLPHSEQNGLRIQYKLS